MKRSANEENFNIRIVKQFKYKSFAKIYNIKPHPRMSTYIIDSTIPFQYKLKTERLQRSGLSFGLASERHFQAEFLSGTLVNSALEIRIK
jgi:hypothetical protein